MDLGVGTLWQDAATTGAIAQSVVAWPLLKQDFAQQGLAILHQQQAWKPQQAGGHMLQHMDSAQQDGVTFGHAVAAQVGSIAIVGANNFQSVGVVPVLEACSMATIQSTTLAFLLYLLVHTCWPEYLRR